MYVLEYRYVCINCGVSCRVVPFACPIFKLVSFSSFGFEVSKITKNKMDASPTVTADYTAEKRESRCLSTSFE